MILVDESYSELPRAERILEFSDDDYRENTNVTMCDESLVSDEEWKEFDENALILYNGAGEVIQYAEEFPMVVYQCSNKVEIMPTPQLNNFVDSIYVSVCHLGKSYSLEKGEMKFERVGGETIAYYIDTFGRYIIIDQHDIHRFLLKKPKLTISKEGLLIFYKEKEILVTLDCDHYAWVDIDTSIKPIDCIKLINGDNVVQMKPYYVKYKDKDDKSTFPAPVKVKKITKQYKLDFEVSFYKYGMFKPKTTQLDDTVEEVDSPPEPFFDWIE